MSDQHTGGPVMDGADDASDSDKLAGLIAQVDHDKGGEGAGAMADELRGRMAETEVEPEEPGDLED